MAFLVATTSLPAVYRPNGYARTMTAGTEVQKVVNPVILDDRKYIQNQGLAENISKT